MRVKAFTIRLDKEYYEVDQNKVNEFLDGVQFKKSSVKFVEGEPNFWAILVHYEEFSQEADTISLKKDDKKPSKISESDLTEEELKIANAMKVWRTQQAELENLPAFMILSNSDIYTVAKARPEKLEDFLQLRGFGEKKTGRYGDDILALLNAL